MGLINEWCLPDLDDKIGSNDGGATGSDDGQELDNSKLRTFKDFVSANSDLIDFGDCGNVKSLVMVINLDSTTQSFLQNNVNGVSASSGTLSYTDFDNAFVDGVDTNTITTGWHCVIITSTTDVACSNLELGHIGATYGDFKCAYLATYSEDLSASQIQRITEEQLYKVNSNAESLIGTLVSNPTPYTTNANTRAYYALEDVNDSSGNGFNLTNNNTCTFVGGKFNNGVSTGTSNTNKSLSINNNLGITTTTPKTIMGWFKVLTAPTNNTYQTFVRLAPGTTGTTNVSYIQYCNISGVLKLRAVSYGSGTSNAEYNIDLGTSEFNHIALTDDLTTCKLYLNGVMVASVAHRTGNSNWSGDLFRIGCRDGDEYASIIADDVVVENRAITEAELVGCISSYASRYLPNKNNIKESLNNWYPFNGNSIDLVNAKNGTDTAITYSWNTNTNTKEAVFVNGTNYITFPSNVLTNSESAITISVWMKANSTHIQSILAPVSGTAKGIYFAYAIFVASQIGCSFYNGSAYTLKATTPLPDTTSWHLYTWAWSTTQGNSKLYLDGKLIATSSDSVGTAIDLSAAHMSSSSSATYASYCNLRDLRIYKKALDATEVDKLFRDTFIN